VCTLECQIAPSRENTLNYQLETGLYVASLQQCRYGRWVVVVVGLGGIPSGYAEPLSYTVHTATQKHAIQTWMQIKGFILDIKNTRLV
jgi:hypothetical protein